MASALAPRPLIEEEMLADAAAGLGQYLIVKRGTNEDDVAKATAASDDLWGVTQTRADDNTTIRVCFAGSCFVSYGGNVSQGNRLTANSSGQAIAASSGDKIIGVAMIDGVANDTGIVLLSQGTI